MASKMEVEFNNVNPMTKPEMKEKIRRVSDANMSVSQPYDLCVVLPTEPSVEGKDPQLKEKGAKLVEQLVNASFIIYMHYSDDKDEVIVLIRGEEQQMRTFADAIDMPMLLDPYVLEERAKAGDPSVPIAPFDILHLPEVTALTPYESIWGAYSQSPEDEPIFWRPHGYQTPFRESVRLKVCLAIVSGPKRFGGCDISMRKKMKNKEVLGFFPLHNMKKRHELNEAWLGDKWQLPQNQPFDLIKNYFGEKIGLYFKFLGHYTNWLLLPGIIGLVLQLIVVVSGNFSHPTVPFFSFFIALWAVLMLEFWKRKEFFTSLSWGMTNFEATETERPEYIGEEQNSYIDGSKMIFFSPAKAAARKDTAVGLISLFSLLVLACVAAVFVIRAVLYRTAVGSYSSFVASLINSFTITVFNFLYSLISTKLTDFENHRTDTLYEDSMITKLFMFQFVNSYSSFFYLAFVAPYRPTPSDDDGQENNVGECGYDDCMIPLAINLATVYGMRLTIGNFMEVCLPMILKHFADKKEDEDRTSESGIISTGEREYRMPVYDQMKGSIDDYSELAIQFGYMTFFLAALPVSAMFAFLNNFVEIRSDAYKLMKNHQRPRPAGAQDIGSWGAIFSVVTTICVVTNAGLIVFTMEVLKMYSDMTRMWVFIGFQWALFTLQYIIEKIIPDEPLEVGIQVQRADFLNAKILQKQKDDDDGQEARMKAMEGGEKPEFVICAAQPDVMIYDDEL